MKDFVIECCELYLQYFPYDTWEDAMTCITTDCEVSRHIQRKVLERVITRRDHKLFEKEVTNANHI